MPSPLLQQPHRRIDDAPGNKERRLCRMNTREDLWWMARDAVGWKVLQEYRVELHLKSSLQITKAQLAALLVRHSTKEEGK